MKQLADLQLRIKKSQCCYDIKAAAATILKQQLAVLASHGT